MKSYRMRIVIGNMASTTYCSAKSKADAIKKFVAGYKPEFQDVMSKCIAPQVTDSDSEKTEKMND